MCVSGGVAIGTAGLGDGSPGWLSRTQYDFLLFDCQHSELELKQLAPIIATMAPGSCPIVRVGENVADQICYALDAGAKGIVIPMVNTAQQAEDAVARCKYHPKGVRSNAGARGGLGVGFGSDPVGYREYMDFFNE